MELIRAAAGLRATTDRWRAEGKAVGLVPTMGALHEGHDGLIGQARRERDRVVVSIFVNPLQFLRGEDFDRYPRDEDADVARAASLGVDAVWAPSVDEMYPSGVTLAEPDPGPAGDVFEGAVRPGHFAGVLKAVHRLLDVTGPCAAYFGEKDAQQLFLVRRMVDDLGMPDEIVGCPTVREPDGLALSSRNAYLSPEERDQAGCLFLGLSEAAALARAGERSTPMLVAAIAREVGATPLARLEYAAVVEERSFEPIETLDGPARAIVAARFPGARLIDNLRLPSARGWLPAPDKVTMMEVVMAALLADGATPTGDPDEVGAARILAVTPGRVAGIAVAKEAFGRMGARLRPLVDEGASVEAGTPVAELGGPLGAMRAAAPTALRLLERLSSVAAGHIPPDPGAPLDAWAADIARLSPPGPFGDDGPSFRLEIEG